MAHRRGKASYNRRKKRAYRRLRDKVKGPKLQLQNNLCYYCDKELMYQTATIDHVVPLSKGGLHCWENIVIACIECNQAKDDKVSNDVRIEQDINPKKVHIDKDYKQHQFSINELDFAFIYIQAALVIQSERIDVS